MRAKGLFLLLIFFPVFLGLSQEKDIQFETISLEQGLSQSSIRTILQDHKGFMWFGTLDGLNKYDGYEITVYRHDPKDPYSIPDNAINVIYEDHNHTLWVGTRSRGLAKYDKIKDRFYTIRHEPNKNNTLSSNNVTAIFEDKNNIFWIGTSEGLNRYDPETGKFKHYKFNPLDIKTISNDFITTIIGDNSGNIWIGTQNGLNKFNIKTEKFTTYKHSSHLENSICGNIINDLFIDKEGILWIGTNKGLSKMISSENFVSFQNDPDNPASLSADKVTAIVEDEDGILWIGTEKGGLNRFDPKTNVFHRYQNDPAKRNSLSINDILTIYQDRSNIMWIGTSLGGINKWNRAAEDLDVFRHNPYVPHSLSSSQVRCIYQDRSGEIWIGTVTGGLNKWNTQEDKFIHYSAQMNNPYSLSHPHVRSVFEDEKGNFWIATDGGGLNKFNPETEKFYQYTNDPNNPRSLSDDNVWKVYQDSKGNLWIGTESGLNRYNYETDDFEVFNHEPGNKGSLSHNHITTLLEDSKQRLWIGTMGGGLNRWHPKTKSFSHYMHDENDPASLGDNRVYSIVEDSNNTIWIGTKGSLNKLERISMSFIKFDEEDGFPNNVFMGILEDESNNLWISTNGGLSKFNKETHKIRNYDVKDGLQSNEFLVGSFCKASDGEMFFGGINGFNAFYPEKIKDNPNRPPIVITGFQIFNKDVDLDTSISEKNLIKLDYSQNVFSFDFVALDYIFPEKNQYAYKMEGFDDEWVEYGTRRYVSYTNLPHGEYTFRVKGSNNDGVWNEEGTSIQLIITPPFWKTNIFYIALFFTIVSLIYLYIKLRERKLKRDKRILEETVKERTREVVKQRNELKVQRDLVTEQKKDITDSIEYASRIQNAVLPPEEVLVQTLPDHFVFYRPRNIVSGDFYWMTKKDNLTIVTAADCTGHGVPGAFMSMLGVAFLNEIVNKIPEIKANIILNQLREYVKKSLHQTGKDGESKDGMDIALCIIDREKMKLQYAGAYNPLVYIRNGELNVIKANKMPIGVYFTDDKPFENNEIDIQYGDAFYIYSDGYVDQFGGKKGKKFYSKRFKRMLLEIHEMPMREQGKYLGKVYKEWKGDLEQVDDILVMGFRLTK